MYQILNKNPTIFGDGSQVRAFSYADDSMFQCGMHHNENCIGQIINLGVLKSTL